MAEVISFRAALARIGIPNQVQDAIIAQGITRMQDLVMFQKEQISRMCKTLRERPDNPVDINIRQEQMIETMRFWVQQRLRGNLPITPALFTLEVAQNEAINMVTALEETKEKEPDIKMPDKFKMTTKWVVFSEAFTTYLNRLKGTTSKIPLNYIIREHEVPLANAVYLTESDTLVNNALLQGGQYDCDNERVYGILKQLILEGPAWSFITPNIDRAANGRNAWLALRAHYEGESFMTKQKDEAYAALDAVHYKGERSTFTFEHFTNIMTKAYNDLHRFGEPVLEGKKVRDLLTKITDPKLEAAKQTVRITAGYKDNFAAAVNFLAQSITPLKSGNPRTISEIHSDSRGSGRAGRAHGNAKFGRNQYNNQQYTPGNNRGGGRFTGGRNHGGRQGRYNPRGRGRGTRYIAPQEWANMPYEQRQQVLADRGTLRNVQQLVAIDDMSQVSAGTGVTNPAPPQLQNHGTAQSGAASINQISTANVGSINSSQGSFGGRAAYRSP